MYLQKLKNYIYPASLLGLFRKIQANHGELFIVGGAVRDILLGRKPVEYDLCTNLLPEQIKPLFMIKNEQGAKFGVLQVLFHRKAFEISTYRKESSYLDFRHPKKIKFIKQIRQDLQRRDFTINAFAYNPLDKTFIDEFSGLSDLKAKLIRTIGKPVQRFNEDALRVIRAIRIASQLNFDIEPATYNAINKTLLAKAQLPSQRFQEEITKIILSVNPEKGFNYLNDKNLLTTLFPGPSKIIGNLTSEGLNKTPRTLVRRLEFLFRKIPPKETERILLELQYSNKKIINRIISCYNKPS
ncbi:MAG: CCA tRNA nucleotidyltransferase [Candidatus Margulisbacteria bacterium]|nr:CCA tRNA nucleotidyltransferase [Candidatus Margulisiibacteriota bacterium]